MLLESCSSSSVKVSAGLSNFVTACLQKQFEKKNFPEKWSFSKNAEVQWTFFGNCRMNFGRAVKIAFRVPIRNIFKKVLFLRKNLFHLIFAKRSGKFFALCWSFIRWVVKISFHVSNGTFWGIYFFPICFLSFPIPDTDGKILCNFGKHSYGIVKTDSRCMSKGKYWRKNFQSKYCVFHPFWTRSQKISAFWQIFQGRVLKLHSTCPQKQFENFFAKKNLVPSFLEFKGKKLRLFPEKYRRGCQNCIVPVHRNISRSFLRKKYHSITFGRCWRVVRPLPEKLRRGCEIL